MPLMLDGETARDWRVRKIALLGPGIVGMPMAALLADARPRIGQDEPATVLVVQRNSKTSGWKVAAIREGRPVIGGVEPGLDDVAREAVKAGLLDATHDVADAADADVILVCIQTDKDGVGPDYGPMYGGLDGLARALLDRPAGNVPLVIIDSTLAPSSMATVIKERFERVGLQEGRDVLLANSPNRVMPGRLVERIRASDKLVAGLHPAAPGMVSRLYAHIVTEARLLETNSLTAEVVKTFENAYRDVRIAFAHEILRECDARGVDFFALRDRVNERIGQTDEASADAVKVPTGGVLVPTIGVGGHCLPKDGVLLWWRYRDLGGVPDDSLILTARVLNDEAPGYAADRLEAAAGPVAGRRVALLGVAYRGDSEDTRNSPTLQLAARLLERGADVVLHDPYVRRGDQNLLRTDLNERYTRDRAAALAQAHAVVLCAPHRVYRDEIDAVQAEAAGAAVLFDGCNLIGPGLQEGLSLPYAGLGRGGQAPDDGFCAQVEDRFRRVERGVALEMRALIETLNTHYAATDFERIDFDRFRYLAGTCTTGCEVVDPDVALPPRAPDARLALRLVPGVSNT